jgi:hypothetical protein
MGRPTKLTDELRDEICATIRDGNFPATAAQFHGVGESTFYEWKKRFPEFRDAIARAQAEAEVNLLGHLRVRMADKMGASAIQWLLERWNRKRFGSQTKVEIVSEVNRIIDVAGRVLQPDQFARLLEALAEDDDEVFGEEDARSASPSVAEH